MVSTESLVSLATAERQELRRSAERWLDRYCPASVPRACHDDAEADNAVLWPEMAALGWPGLHVAESSGGSGGGLEDLAVVLEETGRRLVPGPLSMTCLAAALVQVGSADEQREELLPELAEGRTTAAVATGAGVLRAMARGDQLVLSGTLRPVLGASDASVLLVPVGLPPGEAPAGSSGDSVCWAAVKASAASIVRLPGVDPTRTVCELRFDEVVMEPSSRLPALDTTTVTDMTALVLAAESIGGAAWCLDTAVSHATSRHQFGRPIGQFQAVKHRCADMLLAVEQLRAAVWDATRPSGSAEERSLAIAVAAALASETFLAAAKNAIQLLGGIGYTWEHDAHMYLKRAMVTRQLLGGQHRWQRRAARLACDGVRRSLDVGLSGDPELRQEIKTTASEIAQLEPKARRKRLVDEGLLVPHWPQPWQRGAEPMDQVVIDQELAAARVHRDHLGVGTWVVPTLIAHGSVEQQERFIRATLDGDVTWCQLYSEPNAGSDLAALTTRAVRTEGGWSITGQKVWTSLAAQADWGICLARTDSAAPKHQGITCFLVDMRAEGIDVRPLRELTGDAMFNEVFLSEVTVPDEAVVGEVDGGWRVARTTLSNERVSMGSDTSFGFGVEALLSLAKKDPDLDEVGEASVGAMVVEEHALALLNQRRTLRALAGEQPGPEASVAKLLGVEHAQRVQELGLDLLAPEAAVAKGAAEMWISGFLTTRCLTIAGGTSEIQRNLIAERILGLPRDP